MIYFDAAYIAKLYLAETDSPQVQAHAKHQLIGSSALGKLEVSAVFHRKWREGLIPEEDFRYYSQQFTADDESGLFRWYPVKNELLQNATNNYQTLTPTVFLRASDALHLATAVEHGFLEIYTSDRHLLAAASHFGLTGIKL
jgi:predicted nucleic acid-binding protein